MKKLLSLLFPFSFLLSPVSAQSWLWANQGRNNTVLNDGHGIAMDSAHNAYLTGRYSSDTMIFNSDTLFGNAQEAFLVKYDENGNLLWAKSSESIGNGVAQSQAVATDGQNNVYITGNFYDTTSFQSFSLEDSYMGRSSDVFLVKYDENGNVVWAKQSKDNDSAGENVGQALIADRTGNIYVTGYFSNNAYFDTDTLEGRLCVFVVKYSPEGNILWAKQSVSSRNSSSGILGSNAIAVDKFGYVYITGWFYDTVHFGSQTLVSQSIAGDVFLVKYDSNGNAIWAQQSSSYGIGNSGFGYNLCTDRDGNIYIDGVLEDTLHFGNITLIDAININSIFWAKYDAAGNLIWAKQSYQLDTANWNVWAINTDAAENLYLTADQSDGIRHSNVEIVFDSDTLRIANTYAPNIFLKFDSSGTVLYGDIILVSSGYIIAPLAVDSSGCFVYYGQMVGTSTFLGDTIGPKNNFRNALSWPFIARWSDGGCTTGISTVESQSTTINLYPNPTNQFINLNIEGLKNEGLATVTIMDMTGREILSFVENISDGIIIQINVSSLSSGMYFISIKNKDIILNKKFIKY